MEIRKEISIEGKLSSMKRGKTTWKEVKKAV